MPTPWRENGEITVSRLMTSQDVCDRLRITRWTLYRWEKRGWVPKPRHLGRRSLWLDTEIDEVVKRMRHDRRMR